MITKKKYNVYCDESCHLEKDGSEIMVLGAMYCKNIDKNRIFNDIRNIKIKHGLNSRFEIKWTKVSISKIDFYEELLDYYLNSNELYYRALLAKGKNQLDNDKYNNGDYDLWYYKMYYRMLDPIISPNNCYHIMVDIKDTRGGKRIMKLHEVLCNNKYDYKREVVEHICQIDSRESEILQLTDLLNGAISYYHRGLNNSDDANQGKVMIVKKLKKYYDLDKMTPYGEKKFNLFIWEPKGNNEKA